MSATATRSWGDQGDPGGIPAVYLHGGTACRSKYDPSDFRIIGLDRRGCGRSMPHVTARAMTLTRTQRPT